MAPYLHYFQYIYCDSLDRKLLPPNWTHSFELRSSEDSASDSKLEPCLTTSSSLSSRTSLDATAGEHRVRIVVDIMLPLLRIRLIYGVYFHRKVAIVLEELGLSYETIYLDFAKKEQKDENHTKYNPNGRIPTLIDHKNNDFVIW